MIPPTVPPFPFYIINKDIIKGSFPFRKTFLTPKLDFAARFRTPRVFRRPEEPKQNHGNGINRRRRTLCLPKPDFATRFRSPRVFRRPEEPDRTTETEQTEGEGKFSSPENTPIQRLFYLCPRRLQNPIPDITVRFVRKSAFKPPPAPLLPGKPADRKA